MKPPQERIVDLSAIASGEDRDAAVFFDSLEEIIDLDIGVTIVAVISPPCVCLRAHRLRRKRGPLSVPWFAISVNRNCNWPTR